MSNMASAPPRPLDYLVVLDLETTNDDITDPQRIEIVEFPWLVYDLITQSVRDHKQIFITPKWNSNPNPPPDAVLPFGSDVAFAPSLADALHQFDSYIYHSFISTGKNFYLLTDGHWDLTSLLLVEAARKAVALAPYFRSYINLRKEFSKCYPNAPEPKDRNIMFSYLDISKESRASGIDDCVALAAVVTRLLKDSHRFTQPEYVSDYEWITVPAHIPAIATPVTTATPVGGIVRLRGLPWTCTEPDIEKFLHGIPIVPSGIHFVKTSQGRATGEAFVQLESADAVQAALAKDRQSLGRRYIEVFKSSPYEMANHLERADARRHMYSGNTHLGKGKYSGQNYNPGSKSSRQQGGRMNKDNSMNINYNQANIAPPNVSGSSYVVKVSGLPRNVIPDDLLPVFNGLEMVGNGIHIVKAANSSECTGDAFVEFRSEAWAKKALSRNGANINCASGLSNGSVSTASLDIRKSSAAQMRSSFSSQGTSIEGLPEQSSPGKLHEHHRERGKRTGGNSGRGNYSNTEPKYFIRMRNIDESIRSEDICSLFEKFQIRDDDVRFVKHSNGNGNNNNYYASDKGPSPELIARVAFRSKEVRDTALSAVKRNVTLGNSHVILEDGGSDNRFRSGGRGALGPGSFDAPGNQSSRIVRMRGLPYTSTDADIVQFFEGYKIAPGGISRGKDRHGRASGEAWVTFVNAEDAKQVIEKLDKAHMGSRYIELKF